MAPDSSKKRASAAPDSARGAAPGGAAPPNYWEYIKVEELLALQNGLAPSESELGNDEVLFITAHQVFELWFKLILRELRTLRDFFHQDLVDDQELSNAAAGIRRVVTLFRRATDHFEVLETLATRSYLAFRDKLTPASGFQSAQMRQIEIVLGLKDEDRVAFDWGASYLEALRAHDGSESPALIRVLAEKESGPSLKESVDDWLYRTPIDGVGPKDARAAEELRRFIDGYAEAQAREVDRTASIALSRARAPEEIRALRERYEAEKRALVAWLNPGTEDGGARRARIRAAALFIHQYRELPLLAWPREVLNGLVELEQSMLVFRQRHARMVERVIGRRTGTGGSSGVDYLDQTALKYRVLRDLWAVRTYQIQKSANPPLKNASFYGFRNG